MDEPHAAALQVLELCTGYITDTSTLLRVYLAGRLQQSQITAHVRQQLPSLVKHTVPAGRQSVPQRNYYYLTLKPMSWLLRTAGPDAVGSPAVADALLRAGLWESQQISLPQLSCLPQLAFERGLRLSTQQLVTACKERVKGLDVWIDEARRHAFATNSTSCSSSVLHINQLGDQYYNVPLPQHTSTAELQDLLLVAVNLGGPQPAQQILSLIQQNEQLLYDSSGGTSNSTGSSSSRSIVELVEHLITTAIVRGHWQVAPVLADSPAAKRLSQQAVTQLLYLCIQLERVPLQFPAQEHYEDDDDSDGYDEDDQLMEELQQTDRKAPCFNALCAMPSVQSISASTIASLLRLAVKQKQFEQGTRLCQLPAAQQLPSQQLCELLLQLLLLCDAEHCASQRQQLFRALVRLQAVKELAPGAALQLLSTLIQKDSCRRPWGVRCVQGAHEHGVLTAVGSQLTGKDVLQLLQQAVAQGCNEAMAYIVGLQPAREIDDAEGFVALLRTANDSWQLEVQQLPVMQQLGADAVLGLIQAGISRCSDRWPPRLLSDLLQHPAVGSFTTATLEQLLLDAAQKQRLAAVVGLLKAPTAAGLSVEAVASLLQEAVQDSYFSTSEECGVFTSKAVLPSLLSLPAAEQLSPDAVATILSAAVAAHNSEGISSICELPAAQQIPADAAAALLQEALQCEYGVWNGVLRGLRQVGQPRLTGEQLSEFLQRAVDAADLKNLCELCQHAAETDAAAAAEGAAACVIPPTDMQRLLSAALGKSGPRLGDLPTMSVAKLFQLRAANALGPDAVATLMLACIGGCDAPGLLLVAQLPAAAQLDPEAAERLVRRALQEKPGNYYYSYSTSEHVELREKLLRALLQQPAVQRLAPDAVARLLAQCVEEELQEPLLLLCSELPAARQGALDQGVVRQLLQSAFEAQQWAMFDWLVGLPAAALCDAEVAMWCTVRISSLHSDRPRCTAMHTPYRRHR